MTIDKLPNGWTLVKFGDLVRNSNENSRDLEADGVERVVGLDHLDPGSLRLVRWDELAELPDGTTFTRKFRPGQVLFGKRRAYQRKVAVPDFAGVCSGDILVFEPADDRMLADFLPYLVQSDGFFDHALDTSAGSLSPRTKWAELAKYEFALPPLDEQKRIVELIGAIDRSAGSAESQALRFQTLILALVHETLFQSSGGTTSLRPLAELLVMASAGSWGVDAGGGDSDCMVIRSTEFTNIGALASVAPAIRGLRSKELAKLELRTGDILVERSGGTEDRPVGRVISWPGGPTAVPSNFVHLLRVDESAVPSSVLKWTLWYLHQVGATREFQTASTNMRNLRIKAYLQQLIPVLPLVEAVTLGKTIEVADGARRIENERISDLRALRAQVLSVVLAGGDVY